jgi:DNA polymerase III subunit gamma/tau
MASEVLYRKWRPQSLAEVLGQESVTRTLLNAVRSDRVGHAYLFCGPRGTGKTSTGRILAKAVNCLDSRDGEPCNECEACVSITEGRCLDVIEIDAASNRGVDDIRQLRERVNYASGTVRRKVYIVDEVHMLTDQASNALLKTLEEPPPHVMFILATTEFHKVLPTIVSRCQSFHFRRLSLSAIATKLKSVCEREGIETEDEALAAIARSGGGSLRDAENVLQQLIASLGTRLGIADVRTALGIADESYVSRLIAGLGAQDLATGFRVLHDASDAGVDMRQFGRQMVAALRDVLLIRSGCEDIVEGGSDRIADLRSAAGDMATDHIALAARRFAEITARDAAQPLLALELAFVDAVGQPAVGEAAAPPSGVVASRRTPERSSTSPTERERRSPSAGRRPAASGVESAARSGPSAGEASLADPALPSGSTLDVKESHSQSVGVNTAQPPHGREHDEALVADAHATALAATSPAEGAGEPVALPSPPVEEGELGRVRAGWRDYVDSLRGLGSTGNLDAFLRSACEPVAIEGDVLVLRFQHEFHKSKIEDPKYCHVIEDRLARFFGRAFKVSCVLEGTEDGGGASQVGTAPVAASENILGAALKYGARLKPQA